jgi:hypothetical protein
VGEYGKEGGCAPNMSTKAKRIFAQLNEPKHKNHIVGDINLLDQDETARVGGGDQEMKVLNEMNELQQFENDNWSKGACDDAFPQTGGE